MEEKGSQGLYRKFKKGIGYEYFGGFATFVSLRIFFCRRQKSLCEHSGLPYGRKILAFEPNGFVPTGNKK